LRDFGFGKPLSEEAVRQEAAELCEYLSKQNPLKKVETSHVFASSTMNVMSSIVFGERPGYEDSDFMKLLEIIHFMTQRSSMFAALPIIFPCLNLFSFVIPHLPTTKKVMLAHEFIMKKLAEHRTYMRENSVVEPRDFVEAYFLAQEKYAQKVGAELAKEEFSDWQVRIMSFSS
jgi:hypothetical protein